MKIQREIISKELLKEVRPILETNRKEIDYWGEPLDFDESMYIYADVSDNYRGYTAREDGKILGYVGYWVTPDPHNSEKDQAVQDLLYVSKDYRDSWLGLKLLKYSEEDLKSIGVSYIYQQSSVMYNIGSLFKKLGYEPASVTYKKEI